ncbi:hypothetical protein T484DRAFT_1866971 [Baffinella frigidus]|nr:hypothetical protein T484DRAFT_1866971 [Cryptophyta sp. CCMP2293]
MRAGRASSGHLRCTEEVVESRQSMTPAEIRKDARKRATKRERELQQNPFARKRAAKSERELQLKEDQGEHNYDQSERELQLKEDQGEHNYDEGAA